MTTTIKAQQIYLSLATGNHLTINAVSKKRLLVSSSAGDEGSHRHELFLASVVAGRYVLVKDVKTAGKVAPHENNELLAIVNGEKRIGVFVAKNDDSFWQQWIKLSLSQKESLVRLDFNGETLITLNTPKGSQIRDYYIASNNAWKNDILTDVQWHQLAGRLLGYSEDDIEAFLESDIRKTCKCSTCSK